MFNDKQPITKIFAKSIWVRQGTIKAGESEAKPFPGKIEFNFYGNAQYDHIVIAEDLEAGNKIFAITNIVELYGGKIPSSVNTRLMKTVKKGDHELFIVPGGAVVITLIIYNAVFRAGKLEMNWVQGQPVSMDPNTKR